MKALERIKKKFFHSLKPPKKMTLSEWADTYAVLSAESSAESGKWKTLPYQKQLMDLFTDPKVEKVWVMKSARIGFTKCLNHLVGYHVHQDPCSIMLVQPTVEDAEGYSKEEIAPMIRDTPVLRNLVSDAKSRDGNNTILAKNYPGGTLGMIGANSPRGFRRVSRRIILFDEIDGYKREGAGKEGDQIKLGTKRSEYFWNRKIIGGSTPTIKGYSRIEELFLDADQRRLFVPCPHCGEFQYLKWGNMKWPEGKPEEAFYVCEVNGCIIEHSHKRWMINRADLRATAQGNGKEVSVHIWAAYSLSPNSTWGHLAQEYEDSKKDPELLKVFVNTVLGLPYEEDYTAKITADGIMGRAEDYKLGKANENVLIVTGGVDCQDDRLEYYVYGWGAGEEGWMISHQVFLGDPANRDFLDEVKKALIQPIHHEKFGLIHPEVIAFDTGGSHTDSIYSFCRENKNRNWIAIKGRSQRGREIIGRPSRVDVNHRGKVLKSGLNLYLIGTDTAKDVLFSRLRFEQSGPGYIHFSKDSKKDFFEQLTAEKRVTIYRKGNPIVIWDNPDRARNEAWDCLVYSYSALRFILLRYNRKSAWEDIRKIAELRYKKPEEKNDDDQEVYESTDSPTQNTRHSKNMVARRPKSFATNW